MVLDGQVPHFNIDHQDYRPVHKDYETSSSSIFTVFQETDSEEEDKVGTLKIHLSDNKK